MGRFMAPVACVCSRTLQSVFLVRVRTRPVLPVEELQLQEWRQGVLSLGVLLENLGRLGFSPKKLQLVVSGQDDMRALTRETRGFFIGAVSEATSRLVILLTGSID